MSRNERCALIAAAAAIGLTMTPADAAQLVEPTGYAEMRQLVETRPETEQAIFPGLSAAPLLMGGKRFVAPPGEYTQTLGTSEWVVPEGVYSISLVCIGAGGGSGGGAHAGAAGAGAGALVYMNGVSVVPGETLTVVAGNSGSAGLYIPASAGGKGGDSSVARAGAVIAQAEGGFGSPARASAATSQSGGIGGRASQSVGDVKFSGGAGRRAEEGNSSENSGGAVSDYLANGLDASLAQTSLYGTSGPFNTAWGRGATGRAASSTNGRAGSRGAVRIIWGEGLSYPSNAVIP